MASARLPTRHCQPSLLRLLGTMLFFWPTGLAAQTDPTIAVWEGGVGNWNERTKWIIDGMPSATNTIIPGTVARDFWHVVIDGDESNSVVTLDGPIVFPRLNELEISAGDQLEIKSLLIMETDNIEGATGGTINNAGDIGILGNGVLSIDSGRLPPPDGRVLTLTGGGNVILDGPPGPLTAPGARVIGQGGNIPAVLINENNTISGTGRLGNGSLVIVNQHLITADRSGMRLVIDPGSPFQLFPDDFSNQDGAVLSATNGGILVLGGGTFFNAPTATVSAGDNSFVDLELGARVVGGVLTSGLNGAIRVNNAAELASVDLGSSRIDVLERSRLILSGDFTASAARITLQGPTLPTSLTIEGPVEIKGSKNAIGAVGFIAMESPESLIGGSASGSDNKLTLGPEISVEGRGRIGDTRLSIVNEGTISANVKDQRLDVRFGTGRFLQNIGMLRAIDGGTLRIIGPWELSGMGGGVSAHNDSVVELDGVRVSGQVFQTPDNDTTSRSADEIDLSKGVVRTRANGTVFDLRTSPPSNEGLLEIAAASTLTLESEATGDNTMPPALTNSGTILLSAATGSSFLSISGGDVRLTGGGRVVLSDSQNNHITQSIQETQVNTLINVDNVIEGSGAIGDNRLSFRNDSGGTVRANQSTPLVFHPPPIDEVDVGLRNAGLIEAARQATLQVTGGGAVNTGTIQAQGEQAKVIVQDANIQNRSTIQATEGGVMELRGSAIVNSSMDTDGVIAAGNGSRVELSDNTVVGGGLLASAADGVIRVVDSAGFKTPLRNEANVEVAEHATLTLQSRAVEDNQMPPALTNSGTILLNAGNAVTQRSSLSVSGGDVRLTGGGRVVLSDSPNNRITQPAQEFPRTLINVDNLIEGSGHIGNLLLAVDNQSGGTIRAPMGHVLFIDVYDTSSLDPLIQVALRNGGLIEAASQATLQVTGLEVVNSGTIQAKGQQATTVILGEGLLSTRLPITNTGTLNAEGGGTLRLDRTIVNNTGGTIRAEDGSIVEVATRVVIARGVLDTAGSGVIRNIGSLSLLSPIENHGLFETANGATTNLIGVDPLDILSGVATLTSEPLINMGTIRVASAGETTTLVIVHPVALSGSGVLEMSDNPNNRIVSSAEGSHFMLNLAGHTIRGAGTISFDDPFGLINDGNVIADGVNPLIIESFENRGNMRASGSGGLKITAGLAPNKGTIKVEAGSMLEIDLSRLNKEGLVNKGAFTIDGTATGNIFNRAGGTVDGSGTLNGELVSAGKFNPGRSPGTFTVVGTFEQLPGGESEFEVAGTKAGSQYDQIIVDGTVMLDGVVVVEHLDGFTPAVGTEFNAISATTLVDNGFSLAVLDGGLVRPAMIDAGDGTTALRLTSIDGKRYTQASGSWDTAANWIGGALPTSDETAYIPGDPSSDTTVAGPAADTTVHALVVGSGDGAVTGITALDIEFGTIATTRGTTVRRDARLTGQGTIGGDLYNAGRVAPGHSPGTITIMGNYHQAETGTLAIEIGGTTAGEEFDQLIIGGTAALEGTLDVSLTDLGNGPFEPQGGDAFPILTADEGVGGFFDTVLLPPLGGQLTWNLDYLPNSVKLRAALTGDYNNNGAVEQADLDLVLLNWGADVNLTPLPTTWANQRPAEGLIDQAELDAVLLNWGNSFASLSAASGAGVPEPSTWLVIGVLVACWASLPIRRCRGFRSALPRV